MSNVEFIKFPSLENTYREKELARIVWYGFDQQQYIVTEKVHGAHFDFYVSYDERIGEVVIKCAKRTSFIGEDEKFFNYKPVLEKYRDSLIAMYNLCCGETDTLIICGELFGGNIQSNMSYPLHQDFVGYDVKFSHGTDFDVLDKCEAFDTLRYFGIPLIPVLGVFDSLQEALEVNEYFDSHLTHEGWDGDDAFKEAEGVVIEPVIPSFTKDGGRIYLKKKTKRFMEKNAGVKVKAPQETPQHIVDFLNVCSPYFTEARFEAVCSKIGEVSIKDIGKVTGLFTQDILEDAIKDDELKTLMTKSHTKALQREVMNFIKPLLLVK